MDYYYYKLLKLSSSGLQKKYQRLIVTSLGVTLEENEAVIDVYNRVSKL